MLNFKTRDAPGTRMLTFLKHRQNPKIQICRALTPKCPNTLKAVAEPVNPRRTYTQDLIPVRLSHTSLREAT